MVKSKLQKFIEIFEKNATLSRLFEEFGVDFTPIQKELFDNVLFPNDELIQEKTVLLLSENPEQEGSKEKTQITIRSDNSSDLNDTWINIYTAENNYFIWFNVDSSGTEPSPPNLAGLNQIGIEIAITENEDSTNIANKIITELEATGYFNVTSTNATRNVPATTELTNIAFTDDTINGNANYSGSYFTIYSGSTPYHIWFDIGDTSPAPSVSGDLIEVDINAGSSPSDIAQATTDAINASTYFNSTIYTDNIDIECLIPGSTNDVEENTASGVVSANILRNGYNSYTEVVTNLIVENKYDGNVRNAANSITNSPDFDFTILTQGKDDEIATLNEAISATLGLYPLYIEGPHEDHYRDYKSANGTQYTYLLKWIYYTYKYFNEEQFFFQNLLEHYVPEYDSNIISSVTNLKIYFDGLGILLDTIDQKIEELYTLGNIDEIDESYLQHIAQLLGYQKEDFSIKNISFRELIKNLVEIYQRKGTTYSFELFFKLLGFSAELKEYYWDRDAKNPEGFASVTKYNYLYYLTTQNPATRTKAQYEILEDVHPIQPIRTKDWVIPKDLRIFEELQTQYSLEEILGFKDSDLPEEERFTYFKTNYINFQLTQFYTKQDLTAKDTDTILKYVKFLTPIYVSAFVEVVTTPWEDTFEWENILANDVIIEGDPGTPRWIDILLPFLFVTLKEYIPLSLEPAPEKAVVVTQHGSTDEDSNGFSDSALPMVLGEPDHGITLQGTVAIGSSTVDLSYYKYINVKLDKGRGDKVSIQGNTIQTYQQLIDRLNYRFGVLGIDATVLAYGVTPNIDIRIKSNTTGTNSKIYLANGLIDDLFTSLHLTLDEPVDGTLGTSGYQEFGLNLTSLSQLTGLTPSKTYNLYINVDDEEFAEIDISGPTPATTTLEQIVKSINNFYEKKEVLDFISSANVQYLETKVLTSGKIAIAFRDASTNNGKLIISNIDGTPYRSGINFSRFDCRNVTISPSEDTEINKFFLSYYDTTTNQLKWSVLNNEGEKEINDRVLEDGTVGVKEVQSVTLSNNKVILAYTTSSPSRGYFRIFNIENAVELTSGTGPIEWYSYDINDIRIAKNNDGFVMTGNVGSGSGYIIYFDEDGNYLIGGDEASSTKAIASGAEIAEAVPVKGNDKIFIAYNSNNDGSPPTVPPDYRAYGVIFSDGESSLPEVLVSSFVIENNPVDNLYAHITVNNNILVSYIKSDKTASYKIYDFEGNELRKETLLYNSFDINSMDMTITPDGGFISTLSAENKGVFIRNQHLGEIANATFDGKVELKSILAGDTWDDNVENYAATSDQGHKFEIDDSEYIYDNYSNYLIGQGVDFTAERNRYNTFYETSPNDDLVPLIEDSLTFIFTLLIGTNTLPADNVDKLGFYPSRNGYISRSLNPEVKGNDYKGYYLRHQDISENLRTDPYRVMSEIKWPHIECASPINHQV